MHIHTDYRVPEIPNHHPNAPVVSPRRRAPPGSPDRLGARPHHSELQGQLTDIIAAQGFLLYADVEQEQREREYERSKGQAVSPHPGVDECQIECRSDGAEGTADEY